MAVASMLCVQLGLAFSVGLIDDLGAEGAAWLARIEEENAGELTPERIAAIEAEKAREEGNDVTAEPFLKPVKAPAVALDEEASPTAGRRFTRA